MGSRESPPVPPPSTKTYFMATATKIARASSSSASNTKLVLAVTVMPRPVTNVLMATKTTIKTQIGTCGTMAFSHVPVNP